MPFRKLLVLGIASVLAWAPSVHADDDDCVCKVEIEKLKIRRTDCAVLVTYKVELEGACPPAGFDLVLSMKDASGELVDPEGRPMRIVVPLQNPSDCDDDEREFTGCVEIPVAGDFCGLCVVAEVHGPGDPRPVVAQKVKSVSKKCKSCDACVRVRVRVNVG